MALTRWQETCLALFVEIGMIEPMVRARINASRPEGLDEARFGMLHHLIRLNGVGASRASLCWDLADSCDDIEADIAALAASELINIDRSGTNASQDHICVSERGKIVHENAVRSLSPAFEQLLGETPIETMESAMLTLREIRRTLENLPEG
jgi:hypothetical protein